MNDTCSICKQKVELTVNFFAAGRPPTPPICLPCMKKRSQEIVNNIKKRRQP